MLASALADMLAASVDLDHTRELSLTRDAFDRDTWKGLAEMGLIGLAVDDSYGGSGSSVADLAVVFEALGRSVAAVPLLSSAIAMELISTLGTAEQMADLLPAFASGERIATVAVHETAHGTDLNSLATKATKTDAGWRIEGTKQWVTDLPNADTVIIIASTPDGVAAFAVDTDTAGCEQTSLPALDATRPLGSLKVNAVVPDEARLGDGPDGSPAIGRALDLAVVLMAAEQVGGAQQCLDMSVDYAASRFQFGRAIGSFQAVKHKCADMLVAVEHARSVAWHAATTFGTPESAVAVPLAKSVCSDAYMFAASENIQIHGGIGFTWEHDAHLYFKRAKADALLFGSVDHHRDRLGDAIGV